MKSKVFAVILLLKILQLTVAGSVNISSNETTPISKEKNSFVINYFNLLANITDQLQAKVQTLFSSNRIIEAQLANAESKINNDTSVIISKDQQIKDQLNELKKRDEQVKVQSEQLHLQDEQIRNKSLELRKSEEKLTNMTEVNQKLQNKLFVCEVKIKEYNELINTKEQQIKEANEQVKDQNKQLHLQDEQIKNKSLELQKSEQSLTNMTEVNQKFQNNLLVCKGQIKEDNEVINKKEEQIKEANELLKQQDEQINNKSAELKESEGKVNNMTDIIQNLQNQLDKNIQTHQELLVHKYNIINELTYEIQDKNDTIMNITKTINSLRSQLVNAETQIKEQDEEINQKQQNVMKFGEQLRNAYEKYRQQSKQLKEQNEQLMNKTEQLKQKDTLLETKNNEIKTQSENIKNNKIKISSLNNQIESIVAELSQKRDHLLICSAFQRCPKGTSNGISSIKLPGEQAFDAPCNPTGWMTIQKRFDGSENFNRTWNAYKQGFGDIKGEFFLGLEKLHQMTKAQPHELLIQLRDLYGNSTYAHYDDFQIGSENESYNLKSLGNFSGTSFNGLRVHLGMKFTTYDRDNDKLVTNCANHLLGGWWFNKCGESSLNGKYYKGGGYRIDGVFWPIFVGGKWKTNISYVYTEMMIKPKNY